MEQILGPLLKRAVHQLGEPQRLRRSLGAVLERAARRALGVDADVEVDPLSGSISIVVFRRVVEHPVEPAEIELAEARVIDAGASVGDELGCMVDLNVLAPYLRGALVVPVEQYDPLQSLLSDLMWDLEVLPTVARRSAAPDAIIGRMVAGLHDGPFARSLRPGCDPVELEAHEMMLGCMLPRRYRELLSRVGGMHDRAETPLLSLGREGFRLLSPAEAQAEHVEWTRRYEPMAAASGDGVAPGCVMWNTDWLPMALGYRGAEPTSMLVVDPLGSTAERPGELLGLSMETPGWWNLGVDVAGLAHVWHTLAVHGLLEYQAPGAGDPVVAAKAEAMVRHLLPKLRWIDAD